MSEVKWIKLTTSLPDNKKIKSIRRLPDGNNVILLWVFILARAGESNKKGGLFLTDNIPYTVLDLASDWNFTVEMVEFSLLTLEKYGMIERFDGVIFIKNWEEYQQLDALEKIKLQNRLRQKKYMEKQKQLALSTNVIDDVSTNVSNDGEITENNATDIDIDLDIDLDKNKESRKPRKRVYEDDSIYIKLSSYLFEKICENGAIKKPNLQSWADDVRKMMEIDKRTEQQIENMIEWCQKDSFWSANILSAKKLREKYDTMKKQALRPVNNKQSIRKETIPEWAEKEVKETPMSPEEQEEWDKRLKNYQSEG